MNKIYMILIPGLSLAFGEANSRLLLSNDDSFVMEATFGFFLGISVLLGFKKPLSFRTIISGDSVSFLDKEG